MRTDHNENLRSRSYAEDSHGEGWRLDVLKKRGRENEDIWRDHGRWWRYEILAALESRGTKAVIEFEWKRPDGQ